jgi:hypothetical protein
MAREANYDDSVFVNCPFDAEFAPIFQAIIFVIYRCGFSPRSALEEDNGLDNRLDKIARIIRGCRLGIHDISRIELNSNNLPRFNMPFELGIFFGAKRFGDKYQKSKNALIFERQKYLYQQYISDISGVDTKAHNNDAHVVISKIRDWLRIASKRRNLPSAAKIFDQYIDFQKRLIAISEELELDINDILFDDFCSIVVHLMGTKYLQADL